MNGTWQGVVHAQGGWIGFDQFMEVALYAPGLGYYARGDAQFGNLPGGKGRGSDFATAPGISAYFGRALAVQVAQALQQTRTDAIWEFGAGTGALAAQLLLALGDQVASYTIVDLSGALRQRQRETLQGFGAKVRWLDQLPESFEGVVVGNEVLDAMPVKLLARTAGAWHERGVALDAQERAGLAGPAHAAAPADRDRRRARLPERTAPAGRGFHAHAGRPAGARRGAADRLRISRARVLPPAARHGHRDVPPGAPHGRPAAGRRR